MLYVPKLGLVDRCTKMEKGMRPCLCIPRVCHDKIIPKFVI